MQFMKFISHSRKRYLLSVAILMIIAQALLSCMYDAEIRSYIIGWIVGLCYANFIGWNLLKNTRW